MNKEISNIDETYSMCQLNRNENMIFILIVQNQVKHLQVWINGEVFIELTTVNYVKQPLSYRMNKKVLYLMKRPFNFLMFFTARIPFVF